MKCVWISIPYFSNILTKFFVSFANAPTLTGIISDNNEIRTHNDLVCKRTLNHLAKLSSADSLWSSYVT